MLEGATRDEVRRIGRIPIRNIWLLMLYGSGRFLEYERVQAGLENPPDELPDLVAEVLLHAAEERFRRQLSTGYRSRHAELTRVRGRIDLLATERRQLLHKGRVACRFDELTIDTVRNRMVLAAFDTLASLVRKPDLSAECRSLSLRLAGSGVTPIRPTRSEMAAEQRQRLDATDGPLLAAARLVFDMQLLREEGEKYFSAPDREERYVRDLFESAVGGFYRLRLKPLGWGVHTGRGLAWDVKGATDGIASLLPNMVTDIVLDHIPTKRRIIIDTKFTSIVTTNAHAQDTFKSAHIYQIYAYLRSQDGRGDPLADGAAGMLLYPSIDRAVDETVVIQRHAIRFATVDLAGAAASICDRLLELAGPWGSDRTSD